MKDSNSVFNTSFPMENEPLHRLPTVEELREALADSEKSNARQMISSLFDENTFVELGV